MKRKSFLWLTIVVFASCNSPKQISSSQASATNGIVLNGKLFTAMYQQRAAEYHALCLQAYNLATQRVQEAIRSRSSTKPMAIITDIDETILDNSAYAVHQALIGKDYEPSSWTEWTARASADTVPGALSFFKWAASLGIHAFYITNRDEKDKAGTVQNLVKFGFPEANNDHVLVKQTTSGKEARRKLVMADYDVLLLLGDNLSDFSDLFDKKPYEDRLTATRQLSAQFGNKFIVLPNPGYGDWELSLYQFKSLNAFQKDSAIKRWLIDY